MMRTEKADPTQTWLARGQSRHDGLSAVSSTTAPSVLRVRLNWWMYSLPTIRIARDSSPPHERKHQVVVVRQQRVRVEPRTESSAQLDQQRQQDIAGVAVCKDKLGSPWTVHGVVAGTEEAGAGGSCRAASMATERTGRI